MKNNIFTLFFILTSGFVFAQVNTENGQRGKIKYSDKSILKSADTKKPEVSKPVVVEETEPVIIQRLEYKDPNTNNNNSQSLEVIPNEAKIETETENVQSKQMIKNSKSTPEIKTIDEQIEILDGLIEAIDSKVLEIKNNPEQDLKAKESGWYDQMAKNKKNAIEKQNNLIDSKK